MKSIAIEMLINKFQVYLKESELGIFQITYEDYRLMLIDYLPHMYTIEFYLTSKKPRPTTTYDTIVIPFDKYVWTFMIVCILTQFLLLVLMQQLYNNVTGTENQYNLQYLYEGNISTNLTIFQINSARMRFQTFSPQLN